MVAHLFIKLVRMEMLKDCLCFLTLESMLTLSIMWTLILPSPWPFRSMVLVPSTLLVLQGLWKLSPYSCEVEHLWVSKIRFLYPPWWTSLTSAGRFDPFRYGKIIPEPRLYQPHGKFGGLPYLLWPYPQSTDSIFPSTENLGSSLLPDFLNAKSLESLLHSVPESWKSMMLFDMWRSISEVKECQQKEYHF